MPIFQEPDDLARRSVTFRVSKSLGKGQFRADQNRHAPGRLRLSLRDGKPAGGHRRQCDKDRCQINGSRALMIHKNVSDIQIDTEVMRVNSRLPAYARIKKWYRLGEPFTSGNRMLTANGRLRRTQILHALPALVTASNNYPSHCDR